MKQSEVHGMSQRGGDVQSNLRLSDRPIASDLIPGGQADLIISVEPMESLRYLPFLKKEGWLVTNSAPFINIPNYPDIEKIYDELAKFPRKVILDVESIAREIGSVRTANMVILGAATPFIGIDYAKIAEGVRSIFARKGDEIVEINLKALDAGYRIANSPTL
jgi:indolepyruvate ferredoxin oxidoreductase beta subunit